MRLADFLEENAERVLSAAELFTAQLLPAAGHLDAAAMRDHLPMILEAIIVDLRSPQTPADELLKSHGLAPSIPGSSDTSAQTHALLRAKAGFRIEQMVAEYRALRASVFRLWSEAIQPVDDKASEDIRRFNEAIDQALAESVAYFSAEADRWRELFLAVLGHDLRGPLNAVLLTAELLEKLATEAPATEYTKRLLRSGRRMQHLLDSLLDYSRASLGRGIGIHRARVDLAAACQDELDILSATLPGRQIEFEAHGSTEGDYDASRIREVLGNLVSNAARHSDDDTGIRIRLIGGDDVVLSVENVGAPIPNDELLALFEPLRRGRVGDAASTRANLGLGLFIVQEITKAHGGTVEADSTDGKTTFTVTMPSTRRTGREGSR